MVKVHMLKVNVGTPRTRPRKSYTIIGNFNVAQLGQSGIGIPLPVVQHCPAMARFKVRISWGLIIEQHC
jgi:hypothetical protein